MKLSSRTLGNLAEMICGSSGDARQFRRKSFPYRSSSQLTRFFNNCDLDYIHGGTTRYCWVKRVLNELNSEATSIAQLPSDSIIRVIQELMDPDEYVDGNFNRKNALSDLNKVLERDGIEAYFDVNNKCYIRTCNKKYSSSTSKIKSRPLSAEEILRRKNIEIFLEKATEDEFIDQFLVPLFRQLGFSRVISTGHRDKSLEFGSDVWMKFSLPTGHVIYFSAQVKKDKIDASGRDITKNISGILAQAKMALDYPIFDTETNRKHLVDHVFLISASYITKPARKLLIEHLDKEARRHIIFMDKNELLDLGAMTDIDFPS
jgi:hypothetical protein